MNFSLDDSIGFLLHRTDTRAKNELMQTLKPFDVTPEQWGSLNRLWEQDGIPQKELAARIFKDQPTTARILKKMESKGLVTRQVDPDDRRVYLVFLTDKGRDLKEKLIPLAVIVLIKALKGFEKEEIEQLRGMLNRIHRNLG